MREGNEPVTALNVDVVELDFSEREDGKSIAHVSYDRNVALGAESLMLVDMQYWKEIMERLGTIYNTAD